MALHAETQIPAQYNYWSQKLINSVTKELVHDEINPVSGFDARHGGTLKFNIPGNETFVDLNNSYIKLVLQITGDNGAGKGVKLSDAGTSGLGPVNNIAHSIFRSVRVRLGGQEITLSDNDYAYKAYIQLLTETSNEAQRTYFQITGWMKDTWGKMDSLIVNESSTDTTPKCENQGMLDRRKNFFDNDSGKGEFQIKPHTGICFQPLAIFPYADIEIEMTRHDSPKFFLKSHQDTSANYKIEILEARYTVRRHRVQDAFLANLEKMLEQHPAQFIFPDAHNNPCTIPSGVTNYTNENLFHGNVPRKIIFYFVGSSAYNGDWKKNPFNLRHFNLSSIRVLKNGVEYPWPETRTDFGSTPKIITDAYHRMFVANGADYSDQVVNITRDEYANGYTMFSFLMTPDQNFFIDQNAMTMSRPSQIKIELRFKTALTESIQLMAHYESFTIVTMDHLRRFLVEHH